MDRGDMVTLVMVYTYNNLSSFKTRHKIDCMSTLYLCAIAQKGMCYFHVLKYLLWGYILELLGSCSEVANWIWFFQFCLFSLKFKSFSIVCCLYVQILGAWKPTPDQQGLSPCRLNWKFPQPRLVGSSFCHNLAGFWMCL